MMEEFWEEAKKFSSFTNEEFLLDCAYTLFFLRSWQVVLIIAWKYSDSQTNNDKIVLAMASVQKLLQKSKEKGN